jgi:hypothetical protein
MSIRSGNAPLNTIAVVPAGTNQATARAIPRNASPALVVSAGDNTAGLLLPKATEGKLFHIKNSGAGNLLVYPSGTDAINALGASNPISMATLKAATFASVSGQWWTIPLLPS